jgi:signal transduction histidine kinase
MATVANDIDVNDLSRRLPTSTSGDELEMLGHSFNSLLDRLQESFERQRRFTGDASHQLRTPIASILGQADVALRRTRSTEDYERTLKTVRQQATHLQSIVESLLFLARADSEGRVDRFDLVEASTVLDDLQKSWAEHIRSSDLQIQCTITGSKSLRVQPVLFAELINILINNACKFSEPGTPIVIQLLEEGQSLIFEIRDQGIGISESDLGQVFRPFFRSRETIQRGIEGTGLGLSIALRLALAMGGTLSVKSRPGQGSCFSLRLPISDRPSN